MQPFCYWLLVETIVEYNFNITYSSENEFRELDLFRALVFLGGIVKKTTTNTLHRNSSSTARHATWCKILVLSMYYQNKPQVTPNNSVVDGSTSFVWAFVPMNSTAAKGSAQSFCHSWFYTTTCKFEIQFFWFVLRLSFRMEHATNLSTTSFGSSSKELMFLLL